MPRRGVQAQRSDTPGEPVPRLRANPATRCAGGRPLVALRSPGVAQAQPLRRALDPVRREERGEVRKRRMPLDNPVYRLHVTGEKVREQPGNGPGEVYGPGDEGRAKNGAGERRRTIEAEQVAISRTALYRGSSGSGLGNRGSNGSTRSCMRSVRAPGSGLPHTLPLQVTSIVLQTAVAKSRSLPELACRRFAAPCAGTRTGRRRSKR